MAKSFRRFACMNAKSTLCMVNVFKAMEAMKEVQEYEHHQTLHLRQPPLQ